MPDWWHNRQWRLIQTNLREIDMRDIRAERVVADLRAFKANVLMLNAAGILASYPTKLPFHFQSPFLTGDSLHDILDACHAAEIRVIARTDFSKVRRPIHEANPDWAYRSAAGRIVDYNGDVHVCINGPYQQDFALRIVEELLSTHDFDGIFFNMGGYQTRDYSGACHGICHCRHCTALFHARCGLPLPRQEDLDDPTYRTYRVFQRQTLAAHQEKVYRFLAARWPQLCIANHTGFGRGFIRQESNTALDRPLPHWQYDASDNTRWAVGSFPSMVSSNTTVDFIDFPCRHVAVSPDQQALRLAQSLANGGALDYYLIGRLDNHEDRSGFAPVRDLFHYHATHASAYVDMRPLADTLLLKGGSEGEYRGWFRVLVENHFLFDVMRVDVAADRPWTPYGAVIVPDVTALSDALAAKLDAFAEGGGVVLAIGQSGFRDAAHNPLPAPAMRCLGIEEVLCVREDMRSSYLKVEDPGGVTDLVYLGGRYIHARYASGSTPHLRLIPPHPFGPPERCYYEQVTEDPGFVVHPFGKGRGIHVPWLPGTGFHRQGHVNTAWFCVDVLRRHAGLTPLDGNLPPQVEATLSGKRDGTHLLLHLVNGSGHFGVSFYPPVSMTNLEVAVPCAAPPLSVRGLRGGQALEHAWAEGHVRIRVPRLDLFEAIRIAFA